MVLDSLNNNPSPNKEKNINFLREYLSCEYFTKFGQHKDYSSLVWESIYPEIPMQANYFDCGMFLLQNVEQFCLVSDFSRFINSIQIYDVFELLMSFQDYVSNRNYKLSLMKSWFDQSVTIEKRQKIAELIVFLSCKYNNRNTLQIPTLQFLPENYDLIDTSKNLIAPRTSENFENIQSLEVSPLLLSQKEDDLPILNQKRKSTFKSSVVKKREKLETKREKYCT